MQKFIKSLILVAVTIVSSPMFAQVYGEPIVTWDFSNGIPQDWIVGINSTTDLAHWEYRGPNTEPNVTEGARGSCSAIAAPIESNTQSNGFVIFDGNYWDDSSTACGAGLGTGVDPAPHTAWLTTGSLDFSNISSAVLTFQQQYRHFQTTTKVQISNDGGTTWTDIINNSSAVQSPNVEWRSVNISAWAANQPSVQLKFIYSGVYYWWLLDDITVYVPNDNDLLLTQVGYTNNPEVNGLPSLGNLEYHQYPLLLLPTLNFNASALNVGSFNQSGVRLNTKVVRNQTTEVYNQSSNSQLILAGQGSSFNVQTSFTPNIVGGYTMYFDVLQDSIDNTPLNNADTLDFEVTSFTYAKDEGPMEDRFYADSFYDQFQGSCGNFFNNPDVIRYCHTVQVGLSEGTSVGKQIRAIIYNEDYDTLLAATNVYDVNYADLNEPGEERMVYLDFDQPFVMAPDSTYLIMVQEIDSIEPFYISRSGKSYGESSLIRYININASLISAKSFQVRLSLFAANAHPGCTDAQAMNFEASATVDDGSCRYPGCTNEDADNFMTNANFDDGSCLVGGCMNSEAANFNAFATYDNATCSFPGCTSANALNYDPIANNDDGSCRFLFTAIDAVDLTGCPPLTVEVSNHNQIDSNTVCSYSINGASVAQTCASIFNYTLNQSGIYTLTYSISVANAVADTTITIEVLQTPPTPILSYDQNAQVIACTNCDNLSYQWQFNGAEVNEAITGSIATAIFGQTQNGTYTLEVENNVGCRANAVSLEILEPHLTSSVLSGCVPLDVEFFNTTDTISSMTCSLNSGISILDDFSNSAVITFDTPGTYDAVLNCIGSSTTTSVTITIEVSDQFVPSLSIDQTNGLVQCTNCANAQNILWNIDGVEIEGGLEQPLGGDVYQIQATNEGGCGGTDLLIVNAIDEEENSEVAVYPNPAADEFFVVSINTALVDVISMTGKLMMHTSVSSISSAISTTNWADGIYVVQIVSEAGTTRKKIIVQH